MDPVSQIALTLGSSWASGINLYATMAVLGYLNLTGAISLPESLQILSNPFVLGAAGLMYAVEFFADKIPGIDSTWDALHTFVRIPAGALLAAGGAEGLDIAGLGPALELAAGLVGGGLAATSHAAKSGSRVLINTSPEPVSNWTASLAEDAAVLGGLWTALNHPLWFFALLAAFLLAMIWALPRLWRGIKKVFGWLGRLLGGATVDDNRT